MHHRFIQDIDQVLESMAALRASDRESLEDPIHAFRKSGKRVRALIELFYSRQAGRIGQLRRKIAETARTLSHVRDRHVAIRTAKSLQSIAGVPLAEHASGEMIHSFVEAQSADLERDRDAIKGMFSDACESISRLRKHLREIASKSKSGSPPDGLVMSYRRGRKIVKQVLTEPDEAERFHDLRKITKQLGYQLDWWQESEGLSLSNVRAQCGALGDVLGEGLDLMRLAEQVEEWLREESRWESEGLLVSGILSEGVARWNESTSIACRLYFEGGRSFRGRLAKRGDGKGCGD